MIYYYFQNKEGLYLAVLEEAYRRMRQTEGELNLDNLDPEAALRRLVEFTFDHHAGNEAYIRMVVAENMNRGQYLAQSKTIQALNIAAIEAIEKLYSRGLAQGVFRPGLDPVDIHASISALTVFNVANRHTFGLIFKRDFAAPTTATTRPGTSAGHLSRLTRATHQRQQGQHAGRECRQAAGRQAQTQLRNRKGQAHFKTRLRGLL